MTKSLITANWREGVDAMGATTTNAETTRLLRICADMMDACFKDEDVPLYDLSPRFKQYLVAQGYSHGYIYNLMSQFNKILAVSPTKEFFHGQADKWSKVISCNNKSTIDKTTNSTIQYFLSYVVATGLKVQPVTTTETQKFKQYLVSKGFDPFERADVMARNLRRVLKSLNYYKDELPVPTKIPTQLVPILKKLEIAAVSKSSSKKKTLRAVREDTSEQPVKPNTWKKNARDLKDFVNFNVAQRKFNFQNWEEIYTLERFSDYLDYKNSMGGGITSKTAETKTASIAKSLSLMNQCGFTNFTPEKATEIKQSFWRLSESFDEVFDKKSIASQKRDAGGLPLYENLYSTYLKFVFSEYEQIKKIEKRRKPVFSRKKALIVFICAVEFGWRPQDLAQTIKIENISKERTLSGEDFLFFGFTPSKTSWRSNPPVVRAPAPPWFMEIFDDYLSNLKQLDVKDFIPLSQKREKSDQFNRTTSRLVAKMSFKAFGHRLSVTDYRRIHANFFERRNLPALYLLAGRTASADLTKITSLELKNYSSGGASAEGLYRVRFGKEVQQYLGISWNGKKLDFKE